MTDDPHRTKELRQRRMTNLIGLALVAVVFVSAGFIHNELRGLAEQSRAQTEAVNAQTAAIKAQQARKTGDEKKALYARVTEAASRAAAVKRMGTEALMQEAAMQYKVLYDGPAAMERNSEAWVAMGLFNRALDAYADAATLEKLSLDLAYVCGGTTAGDDISRNFSASSVDPGLGFISEMTKTVEVAEAEFAAQQWLALVDAGKYEESWKAAAGYFQSMVPQERWVRSLAIRQPYGGMLSRAFKDAEQARSLPGAPDGDYVVIRYDTSFANKAGAVETVTPMLEKDGKWRVSGYYIK